MPFSARIYIITLLLFVLPGISFTQELKQGISLERLQRYEEFIRQQINQQEIPGAVVLVARNGETIYKKAFGESDVTGGRALQTDDLFYIQSMTKPIITTAFMMLYEEGHFQLSDPVELYLPDIRNVKVMLDPEEGLASEMGEVEKKITMEHLLTHTAGFSHGLDNTALDRELRQKLFMGGQQSIQERVETLFKFPLVGQPGEQWYYSASPDVLSVLIEKFSGMPTDDFLHKRIFEPLGMSNTFYNVPGSTTGKIVKNHMKDEDGSLMVAENQPASSGVTVWSGVNGLFSTADDYSKFCQMLLNGGILNGNRLLSRKTIEIMTINQTGDLFQGPGHGFGLGFAIVDDLAATDNLGSEGLYFWAGAFNTHFFIDPKEKLIAIFMTQLVPYNEFYHEKLRQFVYQSLIE